MNEGKTVVRYFAEENEASAAEKTETAKNEYIVPRMEIEYLEAEDIITTSKNTNEGDVPDQDNEDPYVDDPF